MTATVKLEDRRAYSIAAAQSIAVPRDVAANVARHLRMATIAAENGVQLVLFPELSLTGYEHGLTLKDALTPDDPRLQPLQAAADAHRMVIAVGAPIASVRGLQIGVICFRPQADATVHLKRFLHPGEEIAYVPGPGGIPLKINHQIVGLAICADINHPEHAADAARVGCSIYATSCFITVQGYEKDAAQLQGYAKTHGMVVLMANYGAPIGQWSTAGKSAIWAEGGTLLAVGPATGEAVVLGQRTAAGWHTQVISAASS